MRISAYVAAIVRQLFILLLSVGVSLIFVHAISNAAHAQTNTAADDFRTPNVDPDVPKNTHSLAQVLMIDVLSAVMCQLSGIDPVNPNQPCIDLNQSTGKLGISQHANGQIGSAQPHIGGALGFMSGQIGMLYQPVISSQTYFDYLSSNFGIADKAYAAPAAQVTNCNTTANGSFGYGYCGLNPIFSTWKLIRDVSYAFLVIAFVVMALGIMLRFKIPPRDVMTLQNQIPRVIVAILLITFSYAIAGFMIDLMWTVTYMGIGAITNGSTAQTSCNTDGKPTTLGQAAPLYLIQNPLGFANSIYAVSCDGLLNSHGIPKIANDTGGAVSNSLLNIILNTIGINYDAAKASCGWTDPGGCIPWAFGYLVSLIIKLIVIIILLITLFRLWFQLLKTAVLFLVYTIGGPIWIVFGLIPGRPLGFEKWLRLEFAHLAAFPLVAWCLVFAKVLAEAYPGNPDPNSVFVPPLIGNPNVPGFGTILAFGLILVTPGIPDIIKEKMKVPAGKFGAQIRGGIASGGALVGGAAGAGAKRLTRKYDPETGREAGALRQFMYGRVLGMKKANADKKDGEAHTTETRRYKVMRRLFGGTLGAGAHEPGARR